MPVIGWVISLNIAHLNRIEQSIFFCLDFFVDYQEQGEVLKDVKELELFASVVEGKIKEVLRAGPQTERSYINDPFWLAIRTEPKYSSLIPCV